MAGDFKHIKVSAAQDDEVIMAGAVGKPAGSPWEEAALQPEPAPAPEPEPAHGKPAATLPSPASEAPAGRQRGGTRRETTLDDLEAGKMPVAQIVVIVAAVVCIIGALVYYFVAMR